MVKESIENISYPRTVNQIDGYIYTKISLNSVRYMMSIYKETKNKKRKMKRSQGVDIHRLLIKKHL